MTKNIVIIGAGPAGLLLAHYLSQRGKYQINIYERRSHQPNDADLPSSLITNGNRSFPISLQERGRKAIRMIPGLESAIANESVFCQGTIVHRQRRKPRNLKRSHAVLTIDRNRLVNILLRQLSDLERVKLHFGYECTQIEDATKTITLQTQSGENFTVNYDLLVGADGASSIVRASLQNCGAIECDCTEVVDVYKSLYLNRLNPSLGIELAGDRIHTASMDNNIRIILVPQPGNQLNGVMIFQRDRNPFTELSTKTEILSFFERNFPVFAPLISELEAETLLKRPLGRVLTVRCDRFDDGDSLLLIGDAAHAVSPSIGQGCNSALEDVFVLGQLIEQNDDDWSKILPAFSQRRVPDAHALRTLSDYSFPRTKLLVVEFFLRLTLGRLFHQYFPRWFSPFLFDLVLDTDMPYSEVLNQNQDWIDKVKFSMDKNHSKS